VNRKKGVDSQERAHRFLSQHYVDLESFAREDFRLATGWTKSTFDTYWTKQFESLLEGADASTYRVKGSFGRYLSFREFQKHVTQVKDARTDYQKIEYNDVLTYEFYLPLAHEKALRSTLDSLFYENAVLPRLRRIDQQSLEKDFPQTQLFGEGSVLDRAKAYVDKKFRGYSIYHVNGRFRGADLMPLSEASKISAQGEHYLIDETTAVVRFIFPCRSHDEARLTRFLFQELFVRSIIELVSGEDEIWIIETEGGQRAHVWSEADSETN
jgi:hypothetical protein